MSQEVALRELVDNAGTQFDPHVVRTLIAVIRRSVLTPLPRTYAEPDAAATASSQVG